MNAFSPENIAQRQRLYERLCETLTSDVGAGSDLSRFRLEEDSEFAEISGYLDLEQLISEIILWAAAEADA